MGKGTHEFRNDPRNDTVLISLNGRIVPRAEAVVSVFDSGFLMGDGVWEGLRLHRGRIAFLDRHLRRLAEGARAIGLDIGLTEQELRARLDEVTAANGMADGVHLRLMVTRGLKTTPYQDPRVNVGGPTVVIIPEYKEALPEVIERGIRLATVHVRRGAPDVQDPKLNSHSKLNCITACIQAANAGADEGLMLDPRGFVATCNSTNFFLVRRGEVWTSTPNYCMNGITREVTLELCRENGIPCRETDFSLTQVYGADEAFVTGTFAGQVPVVEVDGRRLGAVANGGGAGGRDGADGADAGRSSGAAGPVTRRLRELYAERVERECAS